MHDENVLEEPTNSMEAKETFGNRCAAQWVLLRTLPSKIRNVDRKVPSLTKTKYDRRKTKTHELQMHNLHFSSGSINISNHYHYPNVPQSVYRGGERKDQVNRASSKSIRLFLMTLMK